MRCEIVAVGSELLLGSSIDTNSAWLGQQLAAHGIDSHFHTVVGDNPGRIASVINASLQRSDAVIVTGGLGPTQDDVTRDGLADVMGVELQRDDAQCKNIEAIFQARSRVMPERNRQQADRPVGATFIDQAGGTAPGLICPIGNSDKVVYALPGVPSEMREMATRAVFSDLLARSGGQPRTIVSRILKCWGLPESQVADLVSHRFDALAAEGAGVTLAFLAHGAKGVDVRMTASASSAEEAKVLLNAEEAELRLVLGAAIFGTDDETMELAVGSLLMQRQLTLGTAESLTGGLVASRLTEAPGGSAWFRGAVVSYSSDIKFDVLGVPNGPVVTPSAAAAMAQGARRVLGCDVALSLTGVAGPARQEDQPVGTVHCAIAGPGESEQSFTMKLTGDRQRIREFACMNSLDALRRWLLTER